MARLSNKIINQSMETPNGIPKDAKIDLHGLPVEVAKVAVQAQIHELLGT